MRRGHLFLFISSVLAACGADNQPSGCSLDVILDGRPAARTSGSAGASAGLTGPAAAADHGIGIIQKDGTGDFTVIILNLSLPSPPTARVYDPGNVRSYVGNIHDRAGHA
jgi:hypothetical protein